MHTSAALLLYTPNLKTTTFNLINPHSPAKPFLHHQWKSRSFMTCQASASPSKNHSPITEFNLYELLGVEASSDRAQIKEAYRGLQKRCHPDIAGPAGHDMAIVLNEAYALLSDPDSRMAYDKELEKIADFQGYTGRPIYSTWFGSETEDRAVFVDEVKCIGCLKCALFARNTFAVESVYGRARVVAQWADPEDRIQEAIGTCPVNCISIVERSNLAALEFLMSKQPRGRVRVGASNTVGARAGDVFNEMEKFQARYANYKVSSMESEAQMASILSAIQAIQMISNWIYWQSPTTDASPPAATNAPGVRRHAGPSVKRLKAAVEARKQVTATAQPKESSSSNSHEYWVPVRSANASPGVTHLNSSPKPAADQRPTRSNNRPSDGKLSSGSSPNLGYDNPLRWDIPLGTAIVAAAVVSQQVGEPVDRVKDHIGGSLALAIVNSPWSQVALAGVTWYLLAMYLVELVEAFRRK